ncbi:MAG: TIGR00730 family Rossman fold protein, partial [Mycobacteriales bacterium]
MNEDSRRETEERSVEALERSRPHPGSQSAGPVLRRGKGQKDTTTDQRLLENRGPADWVHTDPWRVLRIQSEFVESFGMLAEVGRAVTVFGSARTAADDPYYKQAEELGGALADAGFAVVTGGGP